VVFLYCSISVGIYCGDYFIQDLWYLTIGIRALSLAGIVGNFFFFFADFFFGEEKKRVMTFWTIYVVLYAKFAKNGCISEFLSEKIPKLKKKIV
jgi:hypothetical protein